MKVPAPLASAQDDGTQREPLPSFPSTPWERGLIFCVNEASAISEVEMIEDMQNQGAKTPDRNPMTWGERLGLFTLRVSIILQMLNWSGIFKPVALGDYQVEPVKVLMFWTGLVGFPVCLYLLRRKYSDPDCSFWLILNIPGFLFFAFGFWFVMTGKFGN